MNAPDLFDTSEVFNLAGELLDNSPSAEGIARAAAQAESEARKAQSVFCSCGYEPCFNGLPKRPMSQDSPNSAPQPLT